LFCFAVVTSSWAQEKNVFAFHEQRDYSRWSIFAGAGVSLFDGDATHDYNQILPETGSEFAWGAGLEYSFNPRFGLGLEYNYLPIGADASNLKFSGELHFAEAYLSINLSNLFYYHRLRQRWNIYADLGMGVGFYDSESTKTTSELGPRRIKDGRSSAFSLGLNIEYNISRSWAISWATKYRMFNKDNLEAAREFQGNSNDAVWSSMLGLRWKIGSGKKVHTRNTSTSLYEGYMAPLGGGYANMAEVEKRLDELEKATAAIIASNCIDCIPKSELERLEAKIDLISQQQRTQGEAINDVSSRTPQSVPSIFFAFDSYALDQKARDTLKEIALMMMIRPELKLEIRGYADNEGSEDYNVKLSTNRAMSARQVLVHLYQVDESRITINGRGKISSPTDRYPLNRRCDFIFTKD
jgi:OOP family OmpA-OmpF porin